MKQGEFFGPRPDPKASANGQNVKRAAAGLVPAGPLLRRGACVIAWIVNLVLDRLPARKAGARPGFFEN